MSSTYSERAERISGGEALTRDEVQTLLSTQDGQDFALIEAASTLRRQEFRNMMAIHTEDEELAQALGTRSLAVDSYQTLDLTQNMTPGELAEMMVTYREEKVPGITVILPEQQAPMSLMRILAILRLAAPDRVIHLADGYEESLRSLSSLAMHLVSAITITDDVERWPLVNETLKALRHGGIVIAGAGSRDALAGYLAYLTNLGVDLMGHPQARGSACGSVDGGGCCGGSQESETAASAGGCGCGGEPEPEPVQKNPEPVAASGGCGCGAGGCGAS